MDLGQIPGGLIGNGESNDTFLVPLGDSLGFNPWMVDPFGRGWQNPSNDCVSGLGSGDIYCGGAEDGGSEGGYGTSELDLYSLSGSGGWTINPKDLILKVTSDCFNKDAGRREVTYQLATQSGSPLVGSYNITEQQSDTSLTPPNPWGQSSNDPAVDGNAFNDILQPGLYSSQTVKSTQYFLVSPGGLDIAQWVPISRPGQALSKFNTIVMQGPLSSNPNTVKINGRAAPLCGFI
jgi:hypothetical protein